ncbi:DUF7088 domain-containing protein [Kordiimonas gwangyangensis]|uniref:DUF7088 domain-containing protein n=1 Tax=Kordiimonas gwangyangensis TaxID=288022 RepID=UPI0009DDE4C8
MAAPVNKLMQKTSVQIVLAVLLFLSLTVLADRYLRSAKIDLTDEGLYTLSEGTEGVLSNLDEPVSLTYYFSRSLATPYPQLLSYGKRVEDMLRAFVAENPGKVHLSVVDPEPFSEAEMKRWPRASRVYRSWTGPRFIWGLWRPTPWTVKALSRSSPKSVRSSLSMTSSNWSQASIPNRARACRC